MIAGLSLTLSLRRLGLLRSSETCRGDPTPVRNMVHSWGIYILLPCAVLSWSLSKSILVSLLATLAVPSLAIAQGTLEIMYYRVRYGDAPVPQTPSHGVVQVQPPDQNAEQQQQQQSDTSSPLRLLVIGDSLAIGVGQATSSTPRLPEVLAKTLSRKLGGRVVYWTCHGAPGASTGWIVRELEHKLATPPAEEDKEEEDRSCAATKIHVQSSCSETDDSSSDESELVLSGVIQGDIAKKDVQTMWRNEMAQHRQRPGSQVVWGPYDIAVVLTGSNDLKSAFFPFLLTGEDAKFRREAQARGGSYNTELRRLLEAINQKMKDSLYNLRESVEAATESVRETMEHTLDRVAPGLTHRKNSSATNSDAAVSSQKEPLQEAQPKQQPLVVLPGMPSRVLPIFRSIPLRWLSVPIVDIMDSHKRNLAATHPQVLFVPAPSERDVSSYVEEESEIWQERCEENTILAVRDIRRRKSQQILSEMERYYEEKGFSSAQARPWFPESMPQPSHLRAFSVDGVHPNDLGYDFWGRYIANAIVDEVLQQSKKYSDYR